jgi:hypothetical protein
MEGGEFKASLSNPPFKGGYCWGRGVELKHDNIVPLHPTQAKLGSIVVIVDQMKERIG